MGPAPEEAAECINCSRPGAGRYGLCFDTGRIIEDVTLCEACVREFEQTDFLEVEAAPMLVRGSGEEIEE